MSKTGAMFLEQQEDKDATIAELLKAATAAAATIGSLYDWLERVEKAGGARSISGVAACHAMLTSMRKNAPRVESLVMAPLRGAIAKATP